MISWIQKYFQHHFKTIFAVLLAVTIISFIFTIGASPGIGRGDRRVLDRQFFGYNLNLQDDSSRLMGDASLSASLQLGSFGGLEAEQIQSYAFQRAATLHLADEWHVPHVPADPNHWTEAEKAEISEAIKGLRAFAGADGKFDPKAYATFRDNLKTNPRGLTEADIARIISDDVRAKKVQDLLAGPGYVLPGDIKLQLSRADTAWTVATATADYASFAPAIKPTDAELAKFFDENSFRYEIPPRVVASYAEFSGVGLLKEVSVTDAEVKAFYDANPSRFPKPPEVKPADAKAPATPAKLDPAADFAAVKSLVESTLKLEKAQKLALKAASDVSLALYEAKLDQAVPGPALDAFFADHKLTLKPLAPFTREAGPAEFGGSPEIASEAFKLGKTQNRYVSEALSSPTGAVILVWKDTQPARKPALAEVREKVATDYVENEKRKRFVELGKTIKAQLEARLKAGDTFDKAAAAVSGLKLEAKTLAPFTLRSRPQDMDYSILGALDRLEKGQVSDMVVNADKGLFVYAVDKKAPELSEANPQFVDTRKQLANYNARLGSGTYVSELVERELKRSEPREP